LSSLKILDGEEGVLVGPGQSPRFEGCTITGTSANAVRCAKESSPFFSACAITGNARTALLAEEGSAPVLSGCRITANGDSSGWSVVCRGCSLTMKASTVSDSAG